MKLIPEFIDRPNVLGIGEIGLNRNTSHEMTILKSIWIWRCASTSLC